MPLQPSLKASVVAVQAAIAAAGPLDRASPLALAPVKDAINDALLVFSIEQTRLEALVDERAIGGVQMGMIVPVMISTFLAQKDIVTDLAALVAAKGYIARVGANIHNAPG